jgi:hypothetical protein
VNREYRRALVLVVLGVALLANPLYLYPEDASRETTYTYDATPTDRIPERLDSAADVRSCGWHPMQSWECAVFRDAARGDPVELPLRPDETVGEELFHVDYVRTLEGYYRPNATVENGTLALTLRPASRETVRAALAEDVGESRPFVRRAVANGTATVSEREAHEPRAYFVRDGETYYLVEVASSTTRPTGWGWTDPPRTAIEAMRLVAWLGGVASLWRAGEYSERGRRAAEAARREATRDERTR